MASQNVTDDDDAKNDAGYELIADGPASSVSRTWSTFDGREPRWIVAKSATARRKFSKEPHDIVKELRLLSNLTHANVSFLVFSRRCYLPPSGSYDSQTSV
ncbi:hypothetical protein R3P38DRAFT_2819409, partial [Favolaschia claudopus]